MRWIALLAVLAACEQSGVQIVVYAPADPTAAQPDTVRLFVGVPEEEARAMSPQSFTYDEARDGTFWVRDPLDAKDVLTITPPAPARFVFLPGAVAELGSVVAVGYTNGTPTSAATLFHAQFGDGAVMVYRLGLNPVADATQRADRLADNQLAIWGPPGGAPDACVHFFTRRGDGDPDHRSVFLGRQDDRDCDGLRETDPRECSDDHYLAETVVPSLEDASCTTPMLAPNGGQWCLLGGPGCSDGIGPTAGDCSPTAYCATEPLCARCPQAMDPWGCATEFPSHAVTLGVAAYTKVKCTLRAVAIPNTTRADLCPGDGTVTLVPPPGASCDAVRVRTQASGFDGRFEDDALRVDLQIDQACALTLAPQGRFDLGSASSTLSGLLAIDLSSGRGLAIPLELHMIVEDTASSCQPALCTYDLQADDEARLLACAGTVSR